MNRPHQRVYQGVRSNRYSGSKLTNWTEFHPWHCSVERAFDKYYDEICQEQGAPLVIVEPTHALFHCPLSSEDILDTLAKVPVEFTEKLRAVFVLGGSKKQAKVARSLYCYGTYWLRCIFLAPLPKSKLRRVYRRPPKPSVLREYARAGAEVRETRAGLLVEFNEEAVRRFYIRDVLMHEIGHHVDRQNDRDWRKSEGFAEWFATEYGYRLPRDN